MATAVNKDYFRPAAKPSPDLPFGVRSGGHHKLTQPFTSCDRIISFVQLFWCLRGSGIIEFPDRKRILARNQIAVYYPGMRHCWHTDRRDWEFYWMTMDGPFAATLMAAFGLEAGVYNAGAAPGRLFQTLIRLVQQPTTQAELKACATAFTIITRAAGSHLDQTDELVNAAVRRIHAQSSLPTLNVKTLVAELGIKRSAFTGRFQAAMGIPPGAYLERLRLRNALALLRQKNLTIAEVAAKCGYEDANYFSRIIRRTTGFSPLQFRRQIQTNPIA